MRKHWLALAVFFCLIATLSRLASLPLTDAETTEEKPIPAGHYWFLPDQTYSYRSGESVYHITVGKDALTCGINPVLRYGVDGDMLVLQAEDAEWGTDDQSMTYQTTTFNPPIPVMPRSPRLHQTIHWRTMATINRGTSATSDEEFEERYGSVKFVGLEMVSVPRGTFEALRVETVCHYAGSFYTYLDTDWYAAGVGLVMRRGRTEDAVPSLNLLELL